jgi:hypothetical protein
MRRAPLRSATAALLAAVVVAPRASAHDGPPYPLLVDERAGPAIVSIWADPDVGQGTFYVVLDPLDGGELPEHPRFEIWVAPSDGRLAEARYEAEPEPGRERERFFATVDLPTRESWHARFVLSSERGGGELATDFEVTPPGYGGIGIIWYLAPFLAVGFLWIKAMMRMRGARVERLRSA